MIENDGFIWGFLMAILLMGFFLWLSNTSKEIVYKDRYIIIKDLDIDGVVNPTDFDSSWRINK